MVDFREEVEVGTPMPDGMQLTNDLPYRILVVSDLAGTEAGSISGPLTDGVVEISADTFDEMMAAACPSVSWKATHPLRSGNVMVALDLRFDSIRAFDPKQLVSQIPAAKSLMAIREKLVARMRGKLSDAQLTEAVAAAAASDAELAWLAESIQWTPAAKPPPADPGAVDDVLSQIDLGDGEADDGSPPPKSPVASAVAAAAAGGTSLPAEETAAVRRSLKEIDRRVGVWLTAVLHSLEIQSLESAWRSLALLVSQIDFRRGVRLMLLHAPRPELTERFTTLLIDPVFDEGADAPDLILVDTMFGNSAADMEVLDELAQHGASLPAVVLTNVSADFFGTKFAWQVATLPSFVTLMDQWQFAKWKSLRDNLYARFVGVFFGRCLLRGLHGRDDVPDLEFNYREECVTDKDLVWCGGATAATAAAARSVAQIGWANAMAGHVHGRVEGFATAMGGKTGDKKFGPTDTQMPQPKIEELAAVGVNAAVGVKDHDDAIIWNGLTAARMRQADHRGLLEISLPYQLFATRLSVLLLTLKDKLSGMAPEKIEALVSQHLCDWLGIKGEPAPEQVQVQTRPAEDGSTALELAVTVTAPPNVLPGAIPVVLGYRIR